MDPGAGETRLASGQASSSLNTYVIYVGNNRPSELLPKFGAAHQAFAGVNNEYYGFVFGGGIREYMASGSYRWKSPAELKPVDYTNFVAYAIAHELGHLWGLGHLRDAEESTAAESRFPDNYHHIMNYPTHANPGLARFRNDASHLMEIGNASTGNSSYQSINAHQEVIQSLRQNAAGSFLQETRPNSSFPTLPTYQQDPDDETSMDQQNPPPQAKSNAPSSSLGQAIGTTIASIWNSFVNGFQYFATQLFPRWRIA